MISLENYEKNTIDIKTYWMLYLKGELMVDEKSREKIAKGLEDEEEGRVISLEDYEEKYC